MMSIDTITWKGKAQEVSTLNEEPQAAKKCQEWEKSYFPGKSILIAYIRINGQP